MTDEINMDQLMAEAADPTSGSVVDGFVVSQTETHLIVDVGTKQEASVPKAEFNGQIPQNGAKIPVLITRMRGPEGRPLASWKQARERSNWDKIFAAFDGKKTIEGKITRRIKGGVSVDIGLDAFMPASQIDDRPVPEPEAWVGKTVPVRVLEMDRAKGNVLVSRRKVVEAEKEQKKSETLKTLEEGQVLKGRVTGLTKFGAFVDIGGMEGLLHISDIAWTKVDNPKKIFKIGDEVEVKVLKFDRAANRVSLGRKQLLPHPWDGIENRVKVGSIVKGKVAGFASFGAFVEVEPGVEGLIHVTEISWMERFQSPKDALKAGQEIRAKVVSLDRSSEKLSLSLKRLEENPWEKLGKSHPPGTVFEGEVIAVVPFGVFVKTPVGLEALLRNQDLSWTDKPSTASQDLKPGAKIKVVVLDINPAKEKMSVGVRQLSQDPLKLLKVGQAVTGTIVKKGNFGLVVRLVSGVEGILRTNELKRKRSMFDDKTGKPAESEDVLNSYKEGDELTTSIIKIDRKERKVEFSLRRYERDQERQLLKKYSGDSGRPTLGEATGWDDDETRGS